MGTSFKEHTAIIKIDNFTESQSMNPTLRSDYKNCFGIV